VHGIIETLYRRYVGPGPVEEEAFLNSAESDHGPSTRSISKKGIRAVYEGLDAAGKPSSRRPTRRRTCRRARSWPRSYEDVSTGNEIRSVVLAGRPLKKFPRARSTARRPGGGRAVRAKRDESKIPVNPFTAGSTSPA